MPLITIIIPVFNNRTEDILRCLKSLHDENHLKYNEKIEIIVIDDGSCSECAKVLDLLPSNYPKVKVFHQLNRGVSNARNRGVACASGKYVAFVDADDMVTRSFIPDAIFAIEHTKGKLDVIYGLVEYIETDVNGCLNDDVYERDHDVASFILTEKQKESLRCHFFDLGQSEFVFNNYYISRGPVARLVKKSLAEQHKFEETLSMGEDAVWNLEILKFARQIGIVKRLWYYYIKNTASATQTFSDKSVGQYGDLIWKLAEYADEEEKKACLLKKTISLSVELANGYFLTSKFNGSFLQAVKEFNKMFCSPPWNLVLESKYAFKAGHKYFKKYILIKTGLYLFLQ